MVFQVYGEGFDQVIGAKTRKEFYGKFRILMALVPIGDYFVYEGTPSGDKRLFRYGKVGYKAMKEDGIGDNVAPDVALSKRACNNIVSGVFDTVL